MTEIFVRTFTDEQKPGKIGSLQKRSAKKDPPVEGLHFNIPLTFQLFGEFKFQRIPESFKYLKNVSYNSHSFPKIPSFRKKNTFPTDTCSHSANSFEVYSLSGFVFCIQKNPES